MLKNHNLRSAMVLMVILAVAVALTPGCNRKTTDSFAWANYLVVGGLIIDSSQSTATVVASLHRNDTIQSGADLRFAGSAMIFADTYRGHESVYVKQIDPPNVLAGQQAYFGVVDGSTLSDSVLYPVADTFSITGLVPANHLLQTIAQNVSLDWTASIGAELYVMAAVKVDEAYSGTGYSLYPNSPGPSGTIPIEAFINQVTGELENGLYYVYAYAVTGSPDSALTSLSLPVPLPGQLADDIDERNFKGHFGTVVVSAPDTVRVLTSAR